MTIRLWHQSMTELDEHPAYGRALEQHAAKVLDPSVEVVLHGLRPGTHAGVPPGRTLYSPYAYHVLLRQVIELFIQAEEEGFDAVVIGSFSEPFLREARAAVGIPIVSMAESSLLTACSVATYSVLVTMSPEIAWLISRLVASHKLTGRVVGVECLDPALDEVALSAAIDTPSAFLASFARGAAKGVARFADVIVPAEGIMNEILVAHGVQELDGTCVMDTTAVAWLQAECMVKLRRATGLRPGRRWDHPQLDPAIMARLRRVGSTAGAFQASDP